MYLSKIDLNLTKSGVRRDLGDCHQLHRKVMMGFPDQFDALDESKHQKNECRKNWQVLYRLEGNVLIVQSGIKPNWNRLPEGYLSAAVRELDFQTIQVGDLLKFRLLANPVRQRTRDRQDANDQPILKLDPDGKPMLKKDGSTKNQQKTCRCLITQEDEQIKWLAERLKGSELKECYVSAPGKLKAKSKGATIQTIQFDGCLQVNNVTEFLTVLQQGIGRGRSYGCGLLSIARLP
jgi:CRISPR system Cascade subunit CasE